LLKLRNVTTSLACHGNVMRGITCSSRHVRESRMMADFRMIILMVRVIILNTRMMPRDGEKQKNTKSKEFLAPHRHPILSSYQNPNFGPGPVDIFVEPLILQSSHVLSAKLQHPPKKISFTVRIASRDFKLLAS